MKRCPKNLEVDIVPGEFGDLDTSNVVEALLFVIFALKKALKKLGYSIVFINKEEENLKGDG